MGSCASKTVVRNARQASLRQASGGPASPEMTTPKIAIVYYSMYGHVRTLALAEKKGLESAGCEVTLLKVPETLSDEVLGCVEINQCVGTVGYTRQFFTKSFLGDDAADLARSSGEEPASPRHRAGVASLAWRTTL